MEMPSNFSTPVNTTGIGNPIAPGENGEVGSGDLLVQQKTNDKPDKPKKKKMKSLKDYLKEKK